MEPDGSRIWIYVLLILVFALLKGVYTACEYAVTEVNDSKVKTLAETDPRYARLLKLEKQIANCDLLIIDEMSYLTFNRHQSELLFKVIADRSERKSIIVSTNLAFSEWLTMFENQTMVAAMIDRLTYRSFVLNMNSSKPYRAEFAAQSDIPVEG